MFPFDLFDFDEDGILDPEEENFGYIMASVILDGDEEREDEEDNDEDAETGIGNNEEAVSTEEGEEDYEDDH